MATINLGKDAKVTISGTTVAHLNSFNVDQSYDVQKVSVFGDDDQITVGTAPISRSGSASGYFDPSDTNGQAVFETYFNSQAILPNVRFYINSSNYYASNTGTDTNAGVRITSLNFNATREGNVEVSFSFDISGDFTMV